MIRLRLNQTHGARVPHSMLCGAQPAHNTPAARPPGVCCLQLGYGVPMAWWLVFLPQWIGHAGHTALVVVVLAAVVSCLARIHDAAAALPCKPGA